LGEDARADAFDGAPPLRAPPLTFSFTAGVFVSDLPPERSDPDVALALAVTFRSSRLEAVFFLAVA
jgi:hypothetical protein